MSHKDEFIEFLTRAISEMQTDVKILLEMFDDPELEEGGRVQAAGALLYLLAPGDLIPDTFGLVGQVDDTLVLRLTMDELLTRKPERKSHYAERYPEVFSHLEADLETSANYLGDIFPWLKKWLVRLPKIEFKGKRADELLEDVDAGTWLYDEINEALLDLEYDDDEFNRELRRIDRILPVMREKMEATRR